MVENQYFKCCCESVVNVRVRINSSYLAQIDNPQNVWTTSKVSHSLMSHKYLMKHGKKVPALARDYAAPSTKLRNITRGRQVPVMFLCLPRSNMHEPQSVVTEYVILYVGYVKLCWRRSVQKWLLNYMWYFLFYKLTFFYWGVIRLDSEFGIRCASKIEVCASWENV